MARRPSIRIVSRSLLRNPLFSLPAVLLGHDRGVLLGHALWTTRFAVLSVSVAERMGELGIRVALGAERPQVVLQTLRSGLGLVAGGAIAGIVLYLAVEPVLLRSVPGVLPAGMVLLVGSAGLLLVVALAAALPPALRAGRADPLDLLKDSA